jgi:DNA-binding transcriptional MocR family regulator
VSFRKRDKPSAPGGIKRTGTRRPLRYETLANSVAHGISTGALAAGERLPSVRELARQHSVSLSTATQAMRWLEDTGLVEARPRSGYFVLQRAALQTHSPVSRLASVKPTPLSATTRAELMELANREHGFGAAYLGSELLEVGRIQRCMLRAAQDQGTSLARFESGSGHAALQRAIAQHALRLGSRLDWPSIIITGGCLEAIALALRAVTKPGDKVAIESPTFFGFTELLQQLHLKPAEMPTHRTEGMNLEALQSALEQRQVAAVLLSPALSNPLGCSMPLSHRARLAGLAADYQTPVIEDVVWNDLIEQPQLRTTVQALDHQGWVMLCGSFTKTLAPGLRLGWLHPARWSGVIEGLHSHTMSRPTEVLELTLAKLLKQTGLERHHLRLRYALASRRAQARDIVAATFPQGTQISNPPGGMLLWVELPDGLDAQKLLERALPERISFIPGTLFSAERRFGQCLRVGLGGRWSSHQHAALARLGALACDLAT